MRPIVHLRVLALAPLLLLVAVACGSHEGHGGGAAAPAPPAGPPDAVYTFKGKVTGLPVANAPDGPELSVHHEAIPTFAAADGKVVGMDSMTMPFSLAPGVDLAGIAVGDPVEMRLELRWNETPPARLTAVRKLPADTPLDLR